MKLLAFSICLTLASIITRAQNTSHVFSLTDTVALNPKHVVIGTETYGGKVSLRVLDNNQDSESELRFVQIPDSTFHNGVIEVEMAGQPGKSSGEGARGFVGIAFRIAQAATAFECIYLRPTNGRAEDQVRRNHAVQYISYPGFPWHQLRKDFPARYESYVDLEAGVWTKVRIEVKDSSARLYVHGAKQPTLIVSDLKLGDSARGGIGLWIGPGTVAHFSQLEITKWD